METNKKGAKLAIVVIIAYLLIPLAMTLIYSLFEEWIDVLPKRFTLTAYMEIFSDPVFWLSVGRTVLISIVPILLCTIIVLLAMYVTYIYKPEWDKYVQILCTIPYAVQGAVSYTHLTILSDSTSDECHGSGGI